MFIAAIIIGCIIAIIGLCLLVCYMDDKEFPLPSIEAEIQHQKFLDMGYKIEPNQPKPCHPIVMAECVVDHCTHAWTNTEQMIFITELLKDPALHAFAKNEVNRVN